MKKILPIIVVLWFVWSVVNPSVICSTLWVWLCLIPGGLLTGLLYPAGIIKILPGKNLRNVVTGLIVWIVNSFFILYAIPQTYGLFLSNSASTIELTVSRKSDTRRQANRLEFKEFDCPFCGIKVDDKTWNSIKVGERIKIEGSNTWFGLIIYSIQLH